MNKHQSELLEAAIKYARMGWQVFPCHPTGHQPLVARGFYAASTDEQQIREWWSYHLNAAIGLRTGETSGVFAVDIDPRNGGDISLENMEDEHSKLPNTVESQTGGGGRHLLFRWPDRPVSCSTGKIAPGIDIKGDGGYIILPPSDHKSGRQYCWLFGQGPGECKIADAPEWLLEMVEQGHNVPLPKCEEYSTFCDSNSDNTTPISVDDDIIPDGYRNKTLTSLAGHMRQVGMGLEEIRAALLATNLRRCRPPLDAAEVEQISHSIIRYDPDTSRQALIEHWPERFLNKWENLKNLDNHIIEHGAPIFRCMDDIEIEDIDWLWRGFLAGGKLAMFSGDPGTGKSTISTDLAARISIGAPWPDGAPAHTLGSVILLSKEDAPEDTIKPRLKLAGANMSNVYILEGVKQADLNRNEIVETDFNLDRDLFTLEQLLRKLPDCKLVVIDPIGNYMGQANSHNDASVRSVLGPLAKLAMQYDVAVLAIAHLNKDSEKAAIYRTLGSVGFVGIARIAFGAIKDPDDPSGKRRYLLPIKSNISNDRAGLAYSIETELVGKTDHAKILWEPEPVTISIDDLVGSKRKAEVNDVDISAITGPSPNAEKLIEAVEWLVWRLAHGVLSQKELVKFACQDGISKSTLDRAKKELGITPHRQGFGKKGGWFWHLPDDVDPGDYLGDNWDNQAGETGLKDEELSVDPPTPRPKVLKKSPSGVGIHIGGFPA